MLLLTARRAFAAALVCAACVGTTNAAPAPLPTVTQVDLARYAGAWYEIALLPDTDMDQALAVAERLRTSACVDAHLPRCSVSIGVATALPQDTLDALINRADAGLYEAKAQGRNRVAQAGVTGH